MRIAIDDFGTGYSSLSYLQDLPLDVLKIDRAFIARIGANRTGQSLVRTIQLLAQGLGLKTVAEGVETIDQHDAAVQLGCSMIQGYWYSRPVPVDEIAGTIARIASRHGVDRVA